LLQIHQIKTKIKMICLMTMHSYSDKLLIMAKNKNGVCENAR